MLNILIDSNMLHNTSGAIFMHKLRSQKSVPTHMQTQSCWLVLKLFISLYFAMIFFFDFVENSVHVSY